MSTTHEQHRNRLPDPGAGFIWDEERHGVGPYPVLRAVVDGVAAVYSTRLGGVSEAPFDELNVSTSVGDGLYRVIANRDLAARAIGRGPWWSSVRQVHGADVVEASSASASLRPGVPGRPSAREREADGIWTEDADLTLALKSADCVLALAAGTARFGLAHAGWRGAAAGVVESIVRETSAISVRLGPAIGPCCFEVGAEVTSEFRMRYPGSVVDERHVDLWAACEAAARSAGAKDVLSARICTSCHPELFFSHRRDKGLTGRQALLARLDR